MIEWLKEKWEWVAVGTVALLAFLLGRSGKRNAEKLVIETVENKDKEIEIEKELSAEEKLEIAKAYQKYIATRNALRKQLRNSQENLEKEKINRKLELLELAKEDPDAIDDLLMKEFGIENLS